MTSKKLTIEEAANLVERSPRQIQRYIRDGLKAEVGRDRKKRVTLADLQAWIRATTPAIRRSTRVTDHLTEKYATRRTQGDA